MDYVELMKRADVLPAEQRKVRRLRRALRHIRAMPGDGRLDWSGIMERIEIEAGNALRATDGRRKGRK